MSYTKGEWKYEEGNIVDNNNYIAVDVDEKNAKFILKCVVSHKDLLKACKEALKQLTDKRIGSFDYMEGSEIYDDFKKVAKRINQAIQKAEEAK